MFSFKTQRCNLFTMSDCYMHLNKCILKRDKFESQKYVLHLKKASARVPITCIATVKITSFKVRKTENCLGMMFSGLGSKTVKQTNFLCECKRKHW